MVKWPFGHFALHWTLIAAIFQFVTEGHVYSGESDMETAVCETEEEAGLKLHHIKMIEDFRKELYDTIKESPKLLSIGWLN